MTNFARHLLLAALLLRALVPLGWMPGSAQLGQAAWIICTADGSIQHGVPGRDDRGHHEQPCAFAAAHVMASPQDHGFAAPLPQAATAQDTAAPARIGVRAAFTRPAPRAPPAIA